MLEIPQYVNGYPVTRLDTFGLTDLEGVVGVILPDTMTFIDDISIAGFDLVFVSLPNNEVNIEKNFVGAHALDYYYLPQNFSLSPECSAYGSKAGCSVGCFSASCAKAGTASAASRHRVSSRLRQRFFMVIFLSFL